MTADVTLAIFTALKAHPHGLTVTGLQKRTPYARKVLMVAVQEFEAKGYVIATKEALRPGDSGQACRYRLVTP